MGEFIFTLIGSAGGGEATTGATVVEEKSEADPERVGGEVEGEYSCELVFLERTVPIRLPANKEKEIIMIQMSLGTTALTFQRQRPVLTESARRIHLE